MFFLKTLPSRQMVDQYADRFDDIEAAKVLEALHLMRNASVLMRELEAYFAQHDLSQLRFLAMIVIDRERERDWLAVGEIADMLDVSRPVVTRTLQCLERSGLIAISDNSKDGRSRIVALTLAGTEKLEAILPGYFATLHRAFLTQNP